MNYRERTNHEEEKKDLIYKRIQRVDGTRRCGIMRQEEKEKERKRT
jgi:hypothetical protein